MPNKKTPLRTATDVVHRIRWDSTLQQHLVTVGYLDRFCGILEKPFTDFVWGEHLASLDWDTLAIPHHRIQYFKYNNIMVWNKISKLDLIFKPKVI